MCVLRVTGKHFDVDLYLARSGLTAYKVFHAGEPRSVSQPEKLQEQLLIHDGQATCSCVYDLDYNPLY